MRKLGKKDLVLKQGAFHGVHSYLNICMLDLQESNLSCATKAGKQKRDREGEKGLKRDLYFWAQKRRRKQQLKRERE